MRSVHVFDLTQDRTTPEKLTAFPNGHYIQVLRADGDATLLPGGAQRQNGIPAVPGVVIHADKGVWLHNIFEIHSSGRDSQGVLIVAAYEQKSEILPIEASFHAQSTRIIGSQIGTDNAINLLAIPGRPNVMYYVTGFGHGFEASPTFADPALAFFQVADRFDATAGAFLMYLQYAATSRWSQEWLKFPLFTRPGHELVVSAPAGGAGISSTVTVYGGAIHL